jgi:hypothetical protein
MVQVAGPQNPPFPLCLGRSGPMQPPELATSAPDGENSFAPLESAAALGSMPRASQRLHRHRLRRATTSVAILAQGRRCGVATPAYAGEFLS